MHALPSCDWNTPGADRYTGTVAAAIVAYGLPIATQTALIDAFERRQFTDTVVIDRDSIRGRAHEYQPDLRAMHFGSRGRLCETVHRNGWSAMHVESALVVCAGTECVGIPAVCGNVFRLGIVEPGAAAAAAGREPSAVELNPAPTLGDELPFGIPGEPTSAGNTSQPVNGALSASFAAAAPIFYAPCCATVFSTTAPVPEPSAALLLLAGLGLIAAAVRRHTCS